MYKVAILGCENSHADAFLNAVLKDKLVEDVEFVGVYSDEPEAAQKLHDTFGVPVADSYDAFVGKVDGILITARHGDNHYKYAKPYLNSGIPMFIDKPITCTEADAQAFMAELKANSIRVCGGSSCVLADHVQDMKALAANPTKDTGAVLGGLVHAPINWDNNYGGFFFYTQHLIQVMTEIFGCYPTSVQAFRKGITCTGVVRYPDYDVSIAFGKSYYAGVSFEWCHRGSNYGLGDVFQREFMEFYHLLQGHPQKQSYEDFFAPVYILNAIHRSLESGKEEPIHFPA